MSAQRHVRTARGHTARAVALTVALLSLGVLAAQAAGASVPGSPQSPQIGRPLASTPSAAQVAKAAGAFHQTKTMERVNLINGQNVLVDKRTVSLSVNVTNDLIDKQVIQVTWTGAHPTGGINANPNSPDAQYDEYPMVLLECHGNPSPSAPAAQQIQPQDCWTSTPQERIFSAGNAFPPWRLDRYATAAGQRNLDVGVPSPVPAGCFVFPNIANDWLNYTASSGKNYPIGPGGCAGMPNEMSLLGGGGGDLPDNETFAATDVSGDGSASFDVWTSQTDLDLGCSQTVSCALVAVPIMGISCDPAAASMPAADQPAPGAQEQQAAAACEETGYFAPGSQAPSGESGASGDQQMTVTGQLWWAASNWRNRFVVPLNFAPPSDVCQTANLSNHFVQIYGSELMDQAMLQWQPHFCLSRKLFTIDYVPFSEPAAVTEMQSGLPSAPGSVEAALISNQPTGGFPEPVVHAPVADTGFAISFVIDNAQGLPITTLRLDPRLLAKLLTESYTGSVATEDPELAPDADSPGNTCSGSPTFTTTLAKAIKATQTSITVAGDVGFPEPPFNVTIGSENLTVTAESGTGNTTWTVERGVNNTTPAAAANGAQVTYVRPVTVSNNPANITEDPEFRALNPGVPEVNAEYYAASVLLMLSTNQNVTWALTSYINANPAARAWLNGQPDPWGMVVNCEYKDISLPTSNWPLLSTYIQPSWASDESGPGPCYSNDPTPILPLIASPVPDMPDIAQDIQFYLSQPEVVCAGNVSIPASLHMTTEGQETVGDRFMIGITTLADAERYNLPTAALLTYTKPGTPALFSSTAGMTFAAPDNATLRNAAALLVPDKADYDWTFPYALYDKDSTRVEQAYPGSMLVYADVPTSGLPKLNGQEVDAADYANFVDFAATAGQYPGGAVGQLASGYLPMTAANHLSAEASYAVRAASAIAAQKGAIPSLTPPKKSATAKATTRPGSSTSSASSTSGTGSTSTSATASATPAGSQSASPSPSPSTTMRLALTPEANFGVGGYVLPAVAGLALLAAAGAGVFFWLTRVKGKKWG
jgi:hypothetical protein